MGVRGIAAAAAGLVLSALVAGPASATLITGTFTGTINDSYDNIDLFGAGFGGGTVNGQSVTGSFSYQLDQVPSNFCGTGFGCYGDNDGPDWLKLSVVINGVTLAVVVH